MVGRFNRRSEREFTAPVEILFTKERSIESIWAEDPEEREEKIEDRGPIKSACCA